MKKIILPFILALAAFIHSCDKDDNSDSDTTITQGSCFAYIVVDSLGNNVFKPLSGVNTHLYPPLPPNRDTIPFDPAVSYFVDGLGQKFAPAYYSHNSIGLIFGICKHPAQKLMKKESDSTNSSTFQWVFYLNEDRLPDTLVFKYSDSLYYFQLTDFIIFNSDTIFKNGQDFELIQPFKIQYP